MTSIPVVENLRVFWEGGGVESFAWLLFLLLVALGPLLQGPVPFPRRGGRDPSLQVSSARSVVPTEGELPSGGFGALGGGGGSYSPHTSESFPCCCTRAPGIPIVWWSLPTKHRTLNVEAVKRQIYHSSQLFPELSTIQLQMREAGMLGCEILQQVLKITSWVPKLHVGNRSGREGF